MTSTIGRFHIRKRLGGGGFGEVFLAEDPTIGRQVAIKVFRPKDENLIAFATSSDEEGLQVLRARFLNEAKILAALENIVQVVNVLEYGELPDGAPYYVMPYLPHALAEELGRDVFDVRALEELPPEQRPRALPLERSLALLEQILRGMAAAHARGLIHRDIKPGNLMLTEEGELRIVDFGIAKAPDTSHSTVSHLGLGSRHYMAPEQRESAKHVDARADVYAIGRVAYRMLTGRLPVGRYADPNVAVPALGKPMNDLLLAALSEDREGRPADAGQMLERFIQASKSVGQSDGISDTATWSGDGEAGIRDDLKPLRARIAEMLHATGKIGRADHARLQALAAVADLDEAGLDRLIRDSLAADKRLQAKHKLAELISRQVQRTGRALTPAERETFEEAAQAVGWDRATLENLSKHALEELPVQKSSTAQLSARSERTARTKNESPRGTGRLIGIVAALLVLIGAGWGVYAWRQGQIADAASKQAALQTTPTTTAPISPTTTPAPQSADPQRTRLLTIQDYLNRLGYRVAETGETDPRTVEAIKRFESEHELIVTGAPDELVQTELVKEYDRRDTEAWSKATKAHTETAYLDYREAFPQGAHINEVDSQRDALAWHKAKQADTEAAYLAYRASFPQGTHAGDVDARIDASKARLVREAEEKRLADEKRSAEEKRLAEEKRKAQEAERALLASVQTELKRLGRDVPTDGSASASTTTAIKVFEKATEQPETGKASEALLAKLKAAERWPAPQPGDRIKECDHCPEMVVLRAGSFSMGSPSHEQDRRDSEGPQHTVNVPAFAMGKYAVTFAEYDRFAEATGRSKPADQGWGRGRRPVINVSWEDARAYAAWLSEQTGQRYRLPSEAEWEYAARAGTTGPFSFSGVISPQKANYDSNYTYGGSSKDSGGYRQRTVEVGSLPANSWGLHEVHGNVWEWVEDVWHDNYSGAPSNGSAWTAGGDSGRRVLRGGSWGVYPAGLRSADRNGGAPAGRYFNAGFRLARTL